MDLNARVDVNCGRKDGRTDGLAEGRTENRTPISHLAKAGATIKTVTETLREVLILVGLRQATKQIILNMHPLL